MSTAETCSLGVAGLNKGHKYEHDCNVSSSLSKEKQLAKGTGMKICKVNKK